jgi:hypothetical protein
MFVVWWLLVDYLDIVEGFSVRFFGFSSSTEAMLEIIISVIIMVSNHACSQVVSLSQGVSLVRAANKIRFMYSQK